MTLRIDDGLRKFKVKEITYTIEMINVPAYLHLMTVPLNVKHIGGAIT